MSTQSIYLDNAAATPVDPQVLAVMQPYFSERFYNPSATYAAARAVKHDLDAARASVASILGARPSEIIFTAGGTEANNLAVQGVMTQYPDGEIITSSIEHESVLRPAEQYTHVEVPVDTTGRLLVERLEHLITEKTVLISVMYANNEVGTVQPIRQVVELAEKVRKARRKEGNNLPLYVHTDACQAGNYLDLHVSRLGVDMMTLNGGKIYGPKQSGVLFVASHVRLTPQILGGGQERNVRSGTENVPAAIGFAKALELAQAIRKEEVQRLDQLRQKFIAEMQQKIPGLQLNGSGRFHLPNNVHITILGADNERLLFALDERGVIAAAGSACSASNEEPSHVLRAMGLSDTEAQASLRFTLGRQTTAEEIEKAVQALALVLKV